MHTTTFGDGCFVEEFAEYSIEIAGSWERIGWLKKKKILRPPQMCGKRGVTKNL